jgi:predicted acyl esterase
MWLSDGSRESYLGGRFVRREASDWPVPRTTWQTLWLRGSSLTSTMPRAVTTRAYGALPSYPAASDVPNTAIVGSFGLNELFTRLPALSETNPAEPLALSFTSAPLARDLLSAGPLALDLRLASSATSSELWAVLADVWPDGSSHPLTVGRLDSAFPHVVASQSLRDADGDIVQPYGDYSSPVPTQPAIARTYQVEFWPVGNRFRAGHRIRLVILGPSLASVPGLPAVNVVGLGGPNGSRLLLPVLPR